MRLLFDDEAMKSGAHVRIELSSDRTELNIGTAQRNESAFVKGDPIYTIDRERARSLRSVATAVDYYAKVNRVSSDVTASKAVLIAYRMKQGSIIEGDI